ncbi:MAG: ATP-binding protein [Thermodesulfobacteriota bacterium]
MNKRLSIKILGAFLLLASISVGLTVGLSRYFSYRNFRQYLLGKELEKAELISLQAAKHYSTAGGWEELRGNPRLWRNVLSAGRQENEPPPRMGDGPPFPPPAHGEGAFPRQDGPPPHDPLGLGARICLLDQGKNPVQGAPASIEDLTLVPVTADGRTVGWIGIAKDFPITHPMEKAFVSQQSRALLLIGAAILALSVLVSLILARSLLLPIRMLVQGTKEIARHNFTVRIPVNRSDELGRLASDFNEMAGQLESSAQRQKQWISDISHELRTPLSVLLGSIEALQDGVREPDQETLALLHQKAAHIKKLVNDLHDLSMAESGSLKMEEADLDLRALVRNAVAQFREPYEKQGLAVTLEDPASELPAIRGDSARLTQVFTNILGNSLRYTDTPGRLRIRLTRTENGAAAVFEDSAPGVPEKALPRLFDRLFRADSSRSADTAGSGLGLSICKSIVEAHGGTITAGASSLGGLKIEVRLPEGRESAEKG